MEKWFNNVTYTIAKHFSSAAEVNNRNRVRPVLVRITNKLELVSWEKFIYPTSDKWHLSFERVGKMKASPWEKNPEKLGSGEMCR